MLLLLLLLCLLGYVVGRFGRRHVSWLCYGLAGVLFIAASCGPLPAWLLVHLQAPYATRPDIAWTPRNAIVVLGSGTTKVAGTGQVVPNIFADGRILEAYTLYHACRQSEGDCKLVVSGGDPFRNGVPEATAYAEVLQAMGVERTDLLLETRSMNTWQNAQFVQPMLKAYQAQRIVLVSSAVHLRRAQIYFTHFGIDATPVRGDYEDVRLTHWPNALNLSLTDLALHEYLGVLIYHISSAMGWSAPPSRYGAP
ncbi:YdcF family protein [Dyella jejuensis]|uniref:YdcF family protein n=1 Tax=Dyella jejuensis TaxID=1432009 RepID=A0ABW8JEX4_9GAMM